MDVAGFQDSGGETNQILNQMILKFILSKAKKVKFITTLTEAMATDSRGKELSNLVELLQNVFQGNLDEMINSIQPVFTKVKPENKNFQLSEYKIMLQEKFDQIADLYAQENQLDDDLIHLFDQDQKVQDVQKVFAERTEQNLNEAYDHYLEYKRLNAFGEYFCDKIIACDVLDRPLYQNQGTPVDTFRKNVLNLKETDGSKLFVPLSNF